MKTTTGALLRKREALLRKIAGIVEMRRGSMVSQTVPRKQGGENLKARRGPYPLFTFKREGRTVSRRIHSEDELRRLTRQVENFHRFQELSRQLVEVAEAICEANTPTDLKPRRTK